MGEDELMKGNEKGKMIDYVFIICVIYILSFVYYGISANTFIHEMIHVIQCYEAGLSVKEVVIRPDNIADNEIVLLNLPNAYSMVRFNITLFGNDIEIQDSVDLTNVLGFNNTDNTTESILGGYIICGTTTDDQDDIFDEFGTDENIYMREVIAYTFSKVIYMILTGMFFLNALKRFDII